jgi:Ca-activated chloride channel homolog
MKFLNLTSFVLGFLCLVSQFTLAGTEIVEPRSGIFVVRTAEGQAYNSALLLSTYVNIQVTGPIAKVVVKQKFINQANEFVEGKYLFPLSETAAVNAMTLHVGERLIKGTIQEKEQALKTYQQATREGKHAGLVEQERANLFTTYVANIAPQESILVEITYIETLTQDGNKFSLHFPMTLTPRYTPEINFSGANIQEISENVKTALDSSFKDSKNLTTELANPAHIEVHIKDMRGMEQFESSSHNINVSNNNGLWTINTKNNYVPMDRDFTLQWKISSEKSNMPHFLHEEVEGTNYGLLMIMPPEIPDGDSVLARDVIFIIDTSGSMGGESIEQAKASLVFALDHLNDHQKFNIIEFNSIYRSLFTKSNLATNEYKQQAIEFVKSLEANGGTEMAPALREALAQQTDPEYLRQIIFITDGAVSNEEELFGIIHQMLGQTRLFTVGIGSAPNGYFMKKAAEMGRGTQTLINDLSNVNSKMSKLFTQLEKPLLKDIKIALPENVNVEFYPEKIPDLYAGEPIIVAMKFNSVPETLEISGQGKMPWTATIDNSQTRKGSTSHNSGIASLWARAKIESLSDRILREPNQDALKTELIETAITHKLVSQFTSFVAVEEIITRDINTDLKQSSVENLLPKGSVQTAQYPSTATGLDLFLLSGIVMLILFICSEVYNRNRKTYREY